MPKRSAGLLLWRRRAGVVEVLLVHPGGPFNARKDVWTIPKGEYHSDEEPMAAAYREFCEETGWPCPAGKPVALGEIRQKSGKRVTAWAVEGDADASTVKSNLTEYGWPEVDRAEWMTLERARPRIISGQNLFLDRLAEMLAAE